MTERKAEYLFKTYSVEQGLVNANVIKIVQGQQGFIWIATQDGLYRFDGYHFRLFTHEPNNSNSLPAIYINTLFVDVDGILWVGTDDGLGRYNSSTESFTNYQHSADNPNSISSNIVMSIDQGQNNKLWVATFGGGINLFEPKTESFTHYVNDINQANSLSSNNIYTVLVDKNNIVWAGTRTKGLDKFDPKTGQFKNYSHDKDNLNSISHDKVYTLLEGSDGYLWVGTRGGGLNRFDRDTEEFVRYQSDTEDPNSIGSNHVFSMLEDNSGVLWVGAHQGGLNRLDKHSGKFSVYRHDPANTRSLSDNDVFSIIQDNTGLIWVGTLGEGISKFDPSSARYGLVRHDPSNVNSISSGVIWAIYVDKEGYIWTGADTGLDRFDPITNTYRHFTHDPANPKSLSANDVRSIYQDQQGALWFGTSTGGVNILSNSDASSFTHIMHDKQNSLSLSDNHVSVIHQDVYGEMWFGTQNGLNRMDPMNRLMTRYVNIPNSESSISQNDINTIYSTKDGNLWVGTLSGLNRFNHETQTFTRYLKNINNPNSLSNNSVSSLLEDETGIIWIVTNGGLNRFDRESGEFKHYRKEQGLASDRQYGLLKGANQTLWLGGDGISLFDIKSEKFTNYIGLEAGCFGANAGAYHKGNNDKYYFGSTGYCSIDENNMKGTNIAPKIVFTDFRLLNRSVNISSPESPSPLKNVIDQTKHLTLSYGDNVISFEFAALHFVDAKKNSYRYKLDGFNLDWIETGSDNRRATFTNLAPGNYTLRLTASNNRGKWNNQERTIALTILPPWWLTWWAFALYVAVFLAVTIQFILHQKSKVERAHRRLEQEKVLNQKLTHLDKLKSNFLANTSHELRTPLNGIIGISEMVIDGSTGKIADETKQNLQLVVDCGNRLSQLVNDILDYSQLATDEATLNLASINLYNAVETTLAVTKTLANKKQLEVINLVPNTLQEVVADNNRLQQILFNLVGNAIKFTESGSVQISSCEKNSMIELTIKDTGIGIKDENLQSIFDSFQQADDSTTREYEGSGLGLTIAKRLVELHGGQIKVESTIDVGSAFSFSLPLAVNE
jgi:signal transduction histidine kinase/ligand-binding sensor domain-containing protein